jgi:hypothetical protein
MFCKQFNKICKFICKVFLFNEMSQWTLNHSYLHSGNNSCSGLTCALYSYHASIRFGHFGASIAITMMLTLAVSSADKQFWGVVLGLTDLLPPSFICFGLTGFVLKF